MKETKSPFAFFSTLRSLWFLLGALFLPISGWAAPIGNLGTVPSTSEFPTVYTAGDPNPIAAGLNAVAMIFGHGDVVNSPFAAAVLPMVLMAFTGVLVQSILKIELLVAQWIIMVLVTVVLFFPTTSVRVVSYFDANGTSSSAPLYVDNIPLGVAYALGIAGAIDLHVTTSLETAFSSASADSNFMQMGTDGFAKPLKILLAMRTMYDCNVHQTTCQNLMHFAHYCKFGGANHSSTMDMSQLDTPPTVADTGIVGLINSQRKSYTLYFDPTSAIPTEPKLVPCGVAADGIIAQMKNYVQNNPVNEMFSAQPVTMAHDMATVTAQTDSVMDTPNSTFTGANSAYDTYAQLIQNVTAQTGGDANTFMINQVFSPTVLAAIRADANPNSAVAFQQIMGEAYERARVSMAASGSMFVNFMTASMNLFTFLFAALAPIVALIAVAAGLGATKIYYNYLLFGVWTQSWMPMAAVISYYTQKSFNSMIAGARIKAMAFAPSQIDHLYDNIGNMLATAGTTMSAAPLITLSMLTGSIFAVTSLASRASGSGEQYVDSNRLSPTVDKASNAGAIEDSYKRATGASWVSSMSNGDASGPSDTLTGTKSGLVTDAEAQAMPTVRSGTSISQGAAMVATATANFQKSLSAAADRVSSYQRSAGSSAATSLVSSVDSGWRTSDDEKKDFSDRLNKSIANGQSAQQGTNTNSSLKVGASLGRGGLSFGGGAGGETSHNLSSSTDSKTGVDDTQTYSKGHTASTTNSGATRQEGRSGRDSGENTSAQEASRAVKQAQEAYSQMKSAENSLRSATQMGADSTVPLGTLTCTPRLVRE